MIRLFLFLFAVSVFAQTPVVDTVFAPTGGTFIGRIVITAPNQMKWDGKTFSGWQKSVRLTNGEFNEALVPNLGADPAGTSYHVQFVPLQGNSWVEYWVVPESTDPLKIADIRVTVPPAPALSFSPSQIKPGTVGYCLTSGPSGAVWSPCQAGADPNYFQKSISAVTEITIPASEHGFSKDFFVQVFELNGDPVEPGDISFSGGNVTITFAVPQNGTVVIRTLPADFKFSFNNESTVSIDAESHLIRSIFAVTCLDSSNNTIQTDQIIFIPATLTLGGVVGQSADISISFATPQSGSCIVFGA